MDCDQSSLEKADRILCELDDTSCDDEQKGYRSFHLKTPPKKKLKRSMESLEEFLQKQPDELPDMVNPKRVESSLKNRFLEYCLKHQVTNHAALARRPLEETRGFLMHPQFNAITGNIFTAVTNEVIHRPFDPNLRDRSCVKDGDTTTKIERYLRAIQGWSRETVNAFALDLVKVINRRAGKKNTIWLKGVSNSGKSQMMQTFCDTFFADLYGTPNNNPRTTFTWNDCLFKRIILWEEPNILPDMMEDVKIILGGQPCRVDAKYQTGAILIPTPFIVTSNTDLWTWKSGERTPILNRVHLYTLMNTPVNPTEFFPITGKDWRNFLISKRSIIKDDCNVVGFATLSSDEEDYEL